MGLNLRNETDNISPFSKETRYRVLWALIINQSERSSLLATLLSSTDPGPSSDGSSIMHRTLPARNGTDRTKESERAAQLVTKNVAPNTSLFFYTQLA